jgi:hypothetical protein
VTWCKNIQYLCGKSLNSHFGKEYKLKCWYIDLFRTSNGAFTTWISIDRRKRVENEKSVLKVYIYWIDRSGHYERFGYWMKTGHRSNSSTFFLFNAVSISFRFVRFWNHFPIIIIIKIDFIFHKKFNKIII